MRCVRKVYSFFVFLVLCAGLMSSCEKEEEVAAQESSGLKAYFESEPNRLVVNDLIACAAGRPEGWAGDAAKPVSIFFLPRTGAISFAYWETDSADIDSLDFNAYRRKNLPQEPVWNGKLRRFENTPFEGERWGIVTFQIGVTLYYCDPIKLKVNTKPTQIAPELVAVNENGTTPSFSWETGEIDENVIYFQAISTPENLFVSGTYTYDLNWQFYDLDNVVLNIHDVSPAPSLQENSDYNFTLMGVSEDNWVNLFAEKQFSTAQ